MANCCKTLREEFRLRKLRLDPPEENDFIYCRWHCVPHPFIVGVRLLMFGYTILVTIIIGVQNGIRMFTFFTIWSYILLMLHLGLAATLSLSVYTRNHRASKSLASFSSNRDNSQNTITPSVKDQLPPPDVETQKTFRNSNKHKETPLTMKRKDGDVNEGFEMENYEHKNLKNCSSPRIADSISEPKEQHGNHNDISSSIIVNKNTNKQRESNGKTTPLKPPQKSTTSMATRDPEVGNADSDGTGSLQTQPCDTTVAASTRVPHAQLPCSWYARISWVLASITSLSAPIVTIVYFTAIYPASDVSGRIVLSDLNLHILNLVFVLVDHVLSPRPIRVLHSLAAVLYGIVYIIFSIIYWSVDRDNNVIYSMLDWNSPGLALGFCVGLLVFMFLLQLAYFGLYQVTERTSKR